MAKRGGGRGGKKVKEISKPAKKLKKQVKFSKKVKKAVKAVKKRAPKVVEVAIQPKPVEESAEEKRILKKLPPAKPLKTDRQVMRVFGHPVDPNKIKAAAVEAYNKRQYTIDDISVDNYIRESEWDNTMTKIGILDRVEEQLTLMYPQIDVVRKNKISIEIYLSE
ncbi:MAG: hypothetical protein V1703_01730 [Candidatus Altiarchaeota archaeon]